MIRLVPAERQDENLILDWRNTPEAFSHAAQPQPVSAADHVRWFRDHALDPTRCRLSLITIPVGWVRVDRLEPSGAEVSVYVEPKHREHGYAGAALEQTLARPWSSTVWARVRTDNPTAARFFERHEFQRMMTPPTDGIMLYRRR